MCLSARSDGNKVLCGNEIVLLKKCTNLLSRTMHIRGLSLIGRSIINESATDGYETHLIYRR